MTAGQLKRLDRLIASLEQLERDVTASAPKATPQLMSMLATARNQLLSAWNEGRK